MCARLKAANVKYVEVSLDSIDPEVHNAFRGQPKSWERTVQGIRNCVASGIRTGMATCFTRNTAHKVDDTIQFALDLGCKTFSHFNFIPVGRGKEIMQEDLTPGQRELLLRRLQEHLTEGKITIVSTAPQFGRSCIVYGPEEGLFATGHAGRGPGKKTMVLSRYIGGCGTGRCYCAIQPNGIITPCVYISDIKVGDIRQKSFHEIWNNELFDTLSDREDRGDHCGVCTYRHYCGGCRARALAYTGDIQAGDPGCIYNQHQWQELTTAAGLEDGSEDEMQFALEVAGKAAELVQITAAATRSGELTGITERERRDINELAASLKAKSSRLNKAALTWRPACRRRDVSHGGIRPKALPKGMAPIGRRSEKRRRLRSRPSVMCRSRPPRRWAGSLRRRASTHWLPIFGFLVLVYIAGSVVAIYTHKSAPWVQAFVAPLLLVLIATIEFWRRQVWKFRARDWKFKETVRQDALNSLAHETANGLNAIRANLAGFDEADSLPAAAGHLKQVEQSLGRIDGALAKAVGETSPKPESGSKAVLGASKSKAA